MWTISASTGDNYGIDSSKKPSGIVLPKLGEQTDPLESEDTRPVYIGLGKWRVATATTQGAEFWDGTVTEGTERGSFESEFFAGECLVVELKYHRPGIGPRLAAPPGTTKTNVSPCLASKWGSTALKAQHPQWLQTMRSL